jgi:hypothetical protein
MTSIRLPLCSITPGLPGALSRAAARMSLPVTSPSAQSLSQRPSMSNGMNEARRATVTIGIVKLTFLREPPSSFWISTR